MKKNTHMYNSLGDYAEPFRSVPAWKLALKEVAVYTLLSVGLVAGCLFVLSFIETYVSMM
jgi:hypothetical protein